MGSNDKHSLDEQILECLIEYGRQKATSIAARLLLERTDINRVLYTLLKFGLVEKHDDFTWTVASKRSGSTAVSTDESSFKNATDSGPNIVPPELTQEQRRLVDFNASGNVLIRGQAGSGKTTVLAARAGHIKGSYLNAGTLLFLTYNAALAAYVTRLLKSYGCDGDVKVSTFDAWCEKICRDLLGRSVKRRPFEESREPLIKDGISKVRSRGVDHRLLGAELEFWDEEIQWIYGQGIQNRERYKTTPRRGRGTKIQVREDDRDLVWDVFEHYHEALRSKNVYDKDDLAGMVLDAIRAKGKQIYEDQRVDHLFIDEVQDFNKAWLVILSGFAKSSISLAGDLAQRIFRRSFTWKDVGIEISGAHSVALSGSFRTTKQIMEVAVSLAENADVRNDPDYIAPKPPDRQGPPVNRIVRSRWMQAEDDAVKNAIDLHQRFPGDTVVIAAPFNKKVEALVGTAKRKGAQISTKKGNELANHASGLVGTTFYQLKGLEFDHLVLTCLEDATTPEWYFKLGGSETNEEREQYLRRLIYVAMTRAKQTVTLAGSVPFSRFFDEVPEALFSDL